MTSVYTDNTDYAAYTSFLPRPLGPITRQRALGGNARFEREIVWSDDLPLYYDHVCFSETVELFDIPCVIHALKTTLPSDIVPHVEYSLRTDGYGRTFTFVLRPLNNVPITNIKRLSELNIDINIGWLYIACDYIRHRYMGNYSFRVSSISSIQFDVFTNVSRLHATLHDILAPFIL